MATSKVLSKSDKLDLLQALEEKKRRLVNARENYIPNPGQTPIHKSQKRVRAVFAGNAGGKTCLLVNEIVWAATGYNPFLKTKTRVPAKIVVVLDSPPKVDDVFLPEFKKWYPLKPEQCHKKGKPYITSISFDNGSEIIFMFHLQEPLAFEGLELDYIFADEPLPRPIYVALRRGARKKFSNPRFLLAGTPLAASWMRKEIYEPWSRGQLPDTDCFTYDSYQNKMNLADGYLESFESILSEKERQIRIKGMFFDLEGLALAHLFDRNVHVIPKPRWNLAWPVVIAIDPHPQKNHVAIMLGCDPNDRLTYLKEMTIKATPREFATKLKEFYEGYRVQDIVCDDYGSGEMTGGEGFLSFIQVLKDEGIRLRPTRWKDKHDEDWIQRIQDNLLIPEVEDQFGQKRPRLQIVEHCRGIVENIENVQWVKMRNHDEYKPTLDITSKDYLACLKYALAASPRFISGRDRIIKPRAVSPWGKAMFSPKKDEGEGFDEF